MSERRKWVTQGQLRMDAYYYGFNATGVRAVDEILSAVACAGKAYHHTDEWSNATEGEPTYAELIQEAADRAASALRVLGPDSADRPFAELLRDAAGIINASGGGPVVACLLDKAEELEALDDERHQGESGTI